MIEVPEPPHHHHKTGIPWFDLIIPVAILAISVAALLTSLQSERSMHALVEQNRRLVSAQSTPLLMLDSGNQDDQGRSALDMTISNVGTGPAQIGWFRISDAQGVDYSGEALTTRLSRLGEGSGILSQHIGETLMRSGDTRNIFKWPKPKNPAALAAWNDLNQTRFHLHASACYCSIFEECKITEFGTSHPRPVASCDHEPGRS